MKDSKLWIDVADGRTDGRRANRRLSVL